jgi:hypothetical protein
VKVAPSNPANITASCVPSTRSSRCVTRRITSSVRSSDDPGGSWKTAIA